MTKKGSSEFFRDKMLNLILQSNPKKSLRIFSAKCTVMNFSWNMLC